MPYYKANFCAILPAFVYMIQYKIGSNFCILGNSNVLAVLLNYFSKFRSLICNRTTNHFTIILIAKFASKICFKSHLNSEKKIYITSEKASLIHNF